MGWLIRLGIAGVLAFGVLAGGLWAVNSWFEREAERSREAIRSGGLDQESLDRRYPPSEPNEAAMRYVTLLEQIEPLLPRERFEWGQFPFDGVEAWLAETPRGIQEIVGSDRLDSIAEIFLSDDPPTWHRMLASDLEDCNDTSKDPPRAHGLIPFLMRVRSAMHHRSGDVQRANDFLEASWRMSEFVSPHWNSISNDMHRIIREIDVDESVWIERLEQTSVRDRFLEWNADRAVLFADCNLLDSEPLRPDAPLRSRFIRAAERVILPYHVYSFRKRQEREAERFDWLEQNLSACPGELVALSPAPSRAPFWDLAGRKWDQWDPIAAVEGAEMKIEFTLAWLRLKQQRRQEGDWPESLPVDELRSHCHSLRWSYVRGDEQVRLARGSAGDLTSLFEREEVVAPRFD